LVLFWGKYGVVIYQVLLNLGIVTLCKITQHCITKYVPEY